MISVGCTIAEDLIGAVLQLGYFEDIKSTPANHLDNTLRLSPAILLLFFGGSILFFLLSAPLKLGSKGWYLHLVAQDRQPLGSAFSYYRTPARYLRAVMFEARLVIRRTVLGLIPFLPIVALAPFLLFLEEAGLPKLLFSLLATLTLGLFCLLAGVIALVWIGRYFLAEYLYLLYGCRMKDAFRLSAIIMKGRKTILFSLIFSFLPLYLADLFLLARLWTVPRREAAFAQYAVHFMECYQREKETATPKAESDRSDRFLTKEFPCVS